jgi:hypothetical protein
MMKDNIELLTQIIETLTIVIGGAWGIYKFLWENPLKPKVEFDFDCAFLGAQQGTYLAVFTVHVRNKGIIEHETNEIRITIRGIKNGTFIGLHKKEEMKMAAFPDKLVDEVNIVAKRDDKKYKEFYYFIRPGINQDFNYVTPIPEGYRFLLVKCSFKYKKDGISVHTTERVFEVKPTGK